MHLLEKARRLFAERRTIRSVVNNHLLFSQTLDLSVWGSLPLESRDELTRLVRLAAALPGPIIEIGTLFGFTTQLLAAAKRADQGLFTVDNYSWNPFCLPPAHHRAFTRNALYYCMKTKPLTFFEGDAEAFFANYQGPAPALVFLDGSHEYAHVRAEIRHAKRLGSAIICGDDYNRTFPGVMQAVGEEFGSAVQVRNSLWSATGNGEQTRP